MVVVRRSNASEIIDRNSPYKGIVLRSYTIDFFYCSGFLSQGVLFLSLKSLNLPRLGKHNK